MAKKIIALLLMLTVLLCFAACGQHTHEFGQWTTVAAATCTEAGLQERSCECGETETQTIPALGHTEVADAAVEATCTATGLTEGKHCSACGAVLTEQEEVPATGHNTSTSKKVISVSEDGKTATVSIACADCDYVDTQPYTGAYVAAGQAGVYTEGKRETGYTGLVTFGKKTYYLVDDEIATGYQIIEDTLYNFGEDGVQTGDIPDEGYVEVNGERYDVTNGTPAVHKHTVVVDSAAVAATCTESGLTEASHCSVCEVVLSVQEEIPAKGHTKVLDEGVAATCTASGLTDGYHCSACNTVLTAQRTISALGHNYVTIGAMSPTCTETGLTEGISCSRCSDVKVAQQVVAALGHNFTTLSGWAATCTIVGWTDGEICDRCSYVSVERQEIPALGHDAVAVDGYDATCTTDGKTAGEVCNRCAAIISGRETIPATGHSYVDGLCEVCGAEKTSENLEFTLNSDGESYAVTGIGACTDTVVTIPNTYKGLPVTRIGNFAFRRCTGLISVFIPDSVTSIGMYAFSGCTGLTSVTIGNGVTSIESRSFEDCTALTSVSIGSGVTSIGESMFSGCTGLTSIVIPDNVTSIGWAAFSDCTGLTSVTIPDSVTSIGDGAFRGCTGLTSITIPDSVTNIGYQIFCNCTSLTSITIPDSVTSFEESAFRGCTSLETITLPFVPGYLGKIFGATSAADNSEYVPTSLKTVVITGGDSIGRKAFYSCSSLTSIIIPDSVTTIEYEAFYGCYSLTAVYITDIAAWCSIDFGSAGANPLYYAHNLYLNGELITDLVIPGSVTSIGDWAFYYCTSLTSVAIPDSVTNIGDVAFCRCIGLTSITIPDSVTSIGNDAFEGCGSLIEVCNKSSLTIEAGSYDNGNVGYYAKHIITDEVDSTIKTVGDFIFYDDGENVYLVKYVGTDTEITLPDYGKDYEINKYAFYGCSYLISVTIPDSVTGIGMEAIGLCSGLTSITYEGTMEQWNAIEFGDNWKNGTGVHIIHCTDGDIAK